MVVFFSFSVNSGMLAPYALELDGKNYSVGQREFTVCPKISQFGAGSSRTSLNPQTTKQDMRQWEKSWPSNWRHRGH